jgi:hypothetical protein
MEKIYYGVFDYEDEPAVVLVNAEVWDSKGFDPNVLSKEVFSLMADLELEYVEENLWGYFEGSEKDLIKLMEEAGFISKKEVKEEGESILGD